MNLLSFGEVLYDCFGESKKIGGAPLNVAYHFVKLGGQASVISAVGSDELGDNAIRIMKKAGVDSSLIYRSKFPTGRADITMNGNEADYTFNDPCAWDDIRAMSPLPEETDILYFGTLALRNKTSLETFRRIFGSVQAKLSYFDVNLRKDFYSKDLIIEGLKLCDIIKVNENEINVILSLSGSKTIQDLIREYNLKMVIYTLGENGSAIYTEDKEYHFEALKVTVEDTVGAGDSYTACFLYNYLKTNNIEQSAQKATRLSAFVCTKQGGMPEYSINEVESI